MYESYMMFGPVDRRTDTLDMTLATGLARYAAKYGTTVTEAMVNVAMLDSVTPIEGLTITPNAVVPPTEVWLIARKAVVAVVPVDPEVVAEIVDAANVAD